MKKVQKKISLKIIIILGILAFFLLFFLSLFCATKALPFIDGINAFFRRNPSSEGFNSAKTILLKLRLPRAAATVICGSALSVSGLMLQNALNNTLASPGIIGVNTGAGFFVLLFSIFFPFAFWARSLGALGGAILAVLAVYLISIKAGVSKTTLILAGVAVSSLMTAGIDILITLHPEIVSDKVSFNLGGFANLNLTALKIAFPVILAGITAAFLISDGVDLFALGDESAFGLGLNVKAYRLLCILISGLLAGAAVSVCGLLGFLGLIVPNLIRLCSCNSTKKNLLLCILFGSDFLLFCDLLSRVIFFPYELPVGLFLSILGAPFFIFLLINKKKKLGVQEAA